MRPGVLLCSTGTTEAQLMGLATPAHDPALGRAGFSQVVIVVDEPVWFVVGGLSTAGRDRRAPRSTGSAVTWPAAPTTQR